MADDTGVDLTTQDRPKATPGQIITYFATLTGGKPGMKDMLALKGPKTDPQPDYDEIAFGIGDETFNYPTIKDTDPERYKQIRARCDDILIPGR